MDQRNFNNPFSASAFGREQTGAMSADAARTFLRKVFAVMSMGLAITGVVAWLFASKYLMDAQGELNIEHITTIFGGPLRWVIFLAPLAFVLVLSFGINRLSYLAATVLFIAYATVMGISLSSIFILYTQSSIFVTFLSASGLFGALALFGYTTKLDLTKLGTILMVALVALVIAIIVNLFLQSSGLETIICCAGIVIFSGLTAWEVQNLTRIGAEAPAGESGSKLALMGALSLYLKFINLFMFLLRLMGDRR